MKIRITLKDPDGFDMGVQEAVENSLDIIDDLTQDEKDAIYDLRYSKFRKMISKWADCGEYITIEFDLENETAVVLPK